MPSASSLITLAPTVVAALCAISGVSARVFGDEISVATRDMGNSGGHSAGRETGGLVTGATLIAGPTASGKSAAALELAERTGGVIVNTDSMQGYAVLEIVTARPGPEELNRVPHELYGHVHPSSPY